MVGGRPAPVREDGWISGENEIDGKRVLQGRVHWEKGGRKESPRQGG